MEKVKKTMELIKYNIWTLVGFESIYKIITLLIFSPLFLNTFKFITKITGYSYLTLENIVSFLTNPLTIILLLILILFMMVYTIFDIATVIIILDFSYQKKKVKIMEAINISLKKCQNIVQIKNMSLAFLVLFLIPFLNIGVSTSFITTIKIPEFIMEYILNNRFLITLLSILIISLIIILLRWIYSIHYFILENITFKEARKKSINLSKNNKLKDLFTLFLVQLGTTITYLIFLLISILIIFIVSKIFNKILIIKSFTTSIIWLLIAFSFIIHTLLATPISYASLSIMYYFHKNKKQEKIVNITKENKNNKNFKNLKNIFIILGIIAIILGTIFIYGLYQGKYNFNIEYTRTLEVTAHRGASKNYPENTMTAFIKAKELNADWIELDVQQTKDGKIIVIHDTNFKRTTGIDKNTWELDYNDVKKLDAGSFLDKKYSNEKIPLLEEVIKFAKENNIKLNIELKPTGHEENFEKNVVDIITNLNFTDKCVITSQVYDVLKNVKKYNSKIETVYVMSLAYGSITSLKYADHFSVEASSVNKPLVKRIHNNGKKLYVWTVNNKESISKMIDYQVDNIITDNITLAKDTIYESKTSNIIKEYIKLIEKVF